jgi:uncharacterized protein (DUF2141 family)
MIIHSAKLTLAGYFLLNKKSLRVSFGFKLICSFSLLLLTCCSPASFTGTQKIPEGQGDLQVVVKGLRSAEGQLVLSLFSSAESFPDGIGPTVQKRSVVLAETSAEILFQNLPYGIYAISVLHDTNQNGKMEKTWMGHPKEGFGFSGRPEYKFGPPRFSEASFLLTRPLMRVEIDIHYETGKARYQSETQKRREGKRL